MTSLLRRRPKITASNRAKCGPRGHSTPDVTTLRPAGQAGWEPVQNSNQRGSKQADSKQEIINRSQSYTEYATEFHRKEANGAARKAFASVDLLSARSAKNSTL